MSSVPNSFTPDPFDPSELAKLRLSQDFSELSQVKPVITSVACRKPHQQEFIRVRVGEENRFTTGCFTDKDSRETYLVSPTVRDHLVGDVVPTLLVICVCRNSPIPFLWPLTLPGIDSVKTGLRFCPIFPELLPILLEASELAPERSVYCVERYRGAEVNLRTNMLRIIKNAGVAAWPKLFVNLRSTRRTELQESFPDRVVNCWLGHSAKVAAKHYLQVTDEHWTRATEFRSPTGSPIASPTGSITTNHGTKEPSVMLGFDGLGSVQTSDLVPPQGLEPWTR
jgi:hypothetical protein